MDIPSILEEELMNVRTVEPTDDEGLFLVKPEHDRGGQLRDELAAIDGRTLTVKQSSYRIEVKNHPNGGPQALLSGFHVFARPVDR